MIDPKTRLLFFLAAGGLAMGSLLVAQEPVAEPELPAGVPADPAAPPAEAVEGEAAPEDEEDPELLLGEWDVYFREGNYRRAGREITKLAEEYPDLLPVQLALVQQLHMTGKYRRAGRVLDQLADRFEDESGLVAIQGWHAQITGDYEKAEERYRKTLEMDENALETRYRLGALLKDELGRNEEAEKTFGSFYDWYNGLSAEGQESLTPDQSLFLGLACGGYGSPHEALNKMVEAARADPSYVDALLATGWLFLDHYDRPQARKEFEAALAINANHPDAHCGIAACHLAEFGQIDQAEAALKKALRINKQNVKALQLSAVARMKSQDYAGGLEFVEQALSVNPGSLESLSLKAAGAHLTSDEREYERIEAQVKERAEPCSSLLYDTVATFLADRHRYPEAVEFGRKATTADKGNARAFVNLGVNLTRSGEEWQKGLEILEDAYERDPFNVQVFNLLQLFDDYQTKYTTIETEHLRIVISKAEKDVIGHDLSQLLEEAYDVLTKKYDVELHNPIYIEMLPNHDDFSVRSVGQRGVGALGVCFGRVVTLLSPEGMKQKNPQTGEERVQRFNWGQTTWHEFAHVVTLAKTGSRIPRWFTEGLSVFEEKERRPEWARELEVPVFDALASDSIRPITDLNEGFTRGDEIMLSYFIGSLVCEFVRDEFGFEKIVKMLELYNQDLSTARVIEKVFDFDDKEFDTRFREYLWEIFSEYEFAASYRKKNILAWREELDGEPGDVRTIVLHSKLANAYWMNNAVADAEIHAVRSINLHEKFGEGSDPESEARDAAASAYVVLARIYKQKSRLAKAKEFFEKAFELGSDDFFAHRTRAQIAEEEGEVELAIEEYEAALESFPRYASNPDSPYRRLFELYREEGEEEKAFAILEFFCRINDSDLEVRRILAKHYDDTGQEEKLVEILRQARLITYADNEINRMLAGASAGDDDAAGRVRQIRASLAVRDLDDSDRVRLLTDLAEAYLALGQHMDALDAVEDAVAMKQDYLRAEKVMIEIEAAIAQTEGASQELEKRRLERKVNDLTLDSSARAEAYVKLGKMLIDEDDLYEARDVLEEALELPIPVPEAEELLEKVKELLEDEG